MKDSEKDEEDEDDDKDKQKAGEHSCKKVIYICYWSQYGALSWRRDPQ